MSGQKRVVFLILIMTVVAATVAGIAIRMLYTTAFVQERARLVEIAKSRARLIEAVARHDEKYAALTNIQADYPDAFSATLSQVKEAHHNFRGFGKTGEFTLGRLEGDQIVFLLRQRHFDLENPPPVPYSSDIAEPMRQALSGEAGTIVGRDYRGELVLAAYEPVNYLDLGIVAKIDMSEVRTPFLRAGAMAGLIGLVIIFLGTVLFLKIGNPIVRRIEENEKKYRGLFESAADILLLIDRSGVVLDANSTACSSFGVSKEELIGRSAAEKIVPAKRSLAPGFAVWNDEAGSVAREFTGIRRDGTSFPLETRMSPLSQNGRSVILVAARDITERKQAVEKIRELNQDLERRVDARTAELAAANDDLARRAGQLSALAGELTQTEQRERKRLAQILHDNLQQLLVGAKMNVDLLRGAQGGNGDSPRFLAKIEEMLNQSIDVSRSLTVDLCPPILHVGGLVQVMEWLASWIEEKQGLKVDVKTDGTDEPVGEDIKIVLFQAVRELLFNVVKHSHADCASVRMEGAGGNQLRIIVEDRGAGFGPQDSSTSPAEAAGFGLFSIRERLELLGGRMEIDSAPGKGTRVTLLAPVRPEPWTFEKDPRASIPSIG